jgi:cob(I)alamin adenosyltransferase
MRIEALSRNIETIGVSSLKGKNANLKENEIQRVPCDSSPSAAIDVAVTVAVYAERVSLHLGSL